MSISHFLWIFKALMSRSIAHLITCLPWVHLVCRGKDFVVILKCSFVLHFNMYLHPPTPFFLDWGKQAGKEEQPASTSQETQSEDKDCRPADWEQPALAAH